MSGQVKDRADSARRASKAERREARVAAARAAKRRKILYGLLGTFFGTILLIGFAFVVFKDGGGDNSTASQPDASASAGASPAADPNAADPNAPAPDAKFPPLPAGADPALGTKPVVTKGAGTPKELKVTMLIEGKGPAVKSGETILVNYVGVKYATGEQFDASWDNKQAYPVPIGAGQVIKGWDQGLVGVKVGSRVQLDIPSDLAYGDGPDARLPGPLRFVVDVLAIQPA
ncbi:FKBP-type peptidyl-prolyl cis-trans isomerase [Catellatospora sichuanensis]|uniref:FKBP-type peptidyl-prolyl cis-trans isomerase n=1 Tax=Catellatospora sichuanensis TaxID=1969805 RepID=UPI00118461D2|nr:FKBP-type peptidyl-prolyl cis-trans isomerase [Catellatospora sichuanensis]